MTYPRTKAIGKRKTDEYASVEDFCRVFTEGRDDIYGLSFQMTCDRDKAEQCVVAGWEDCLKATRVFKDWARSWARRAVIQNAIRELKPRPRIAISSSLDPPIHISEYPGNVGTHWERDSLLALDVFERFVFVMSFLEGYSEHECSLLLGCTRRDFKEARTRAFVQFTGAHRTVFAGEHHSEMVQVLGQWGPVTRTK